MYYALLIEFFSDFAGMKFWRRRKGFNTVIIFIVGNLSLISLVIIFFYGISTMKSHWN